MPFTSGGGGGSGGGTGPQGPAGKDGLSAYEIAVNNGFTGTEQEWLTSLKATGTAVITSTMPPDDPKDGQIWMQVVSEGGKSGSGGMGGL